MGVVQEHILPPSFDEALQKVAFDAPLKSQQLGCPTSENGLNAVEIDRLNELNQFLGGAADCSRRGSRKALEIDFRASS